MGNCSSEHHAKLFRAENFSNDPTAFRVFVKKKNKFIPGWLKINDDEIVFTRGNGGTASSNNFQFWPLAYLRRYGYTCSGIFFFESGRRCATGEGLHTFQSHQAEKIFHMVQGKIKIEEYARGSRASSVVSNNRTNVVNSSVTSNRIHPVQRFSSEGSANEFRPTASPSLDSTYSSCPPSVRPMGAPPPYEAYQRSLQEIINRRLYATSSPASNCNALMNSSVSDAGGNNYAPTNIPYRRTRLSSTSSAYSTNIINPGGVNNTGNDPRNQRIERPRSVVSALEHGVCNMPIEPLASDVLTLNSTDAQTYRQQQPLADANMFDSLNINHPLDCSFMSSVNGSRIFTASPWSSQQQLEGEIVLEHVLSKNTRKYHHHQLQDKLLALNQQQPPPQQPPQQQFASCGVVASASSNAVPAALVAPIMHSTFVNDTLGHRKYHSYVNVDLPHLHHGMSMSCYGGGGSNNNLSAKLLAAKELHRTSKSRQEFLSSQPGGFIFNSTLSNFNPIMTTSMSGNSSASIDMRNYPPPFCRTATSDGVQRSTSQSSFATLSAEGSVENARLRKRVPQLPLPPTGPLAGSDPYHQQNYALLNLSAASPVSPSNNAEPRDVLNVFDATMECNGDDAKSPFISVRTNYALIDFNKTKTLETVTNIKQQERRDDKVDPQGTTDTNPQGAFV